MVECLVAKAPARFVFKDIYNALLALAVFCVLLSIPVTTGAAKAPLAIKRSVVEMAASKMNVNLAR
ncbi:hypothetical protein [Teredinibacter haidensis]|uniref:hypothetical protein n=1 Tax=Teredinibacter haidensis TaxID=2731755 RepID=UPI0009488CEB|nr:hypothetical protein [Teredinibacter haidensis]